MRSWLTEFHRQPSAFNSILTQLFKAWFSFIRFKFVTSHFMFIQISLEVKTEVIESPVLQHKLFLYLCPILPCLQELLDSQCTIPWMFQCTSTAWPYNSFSWHNCLETGWTDLERVKHKDIPQTYFTLFAECFCIPVFPNLNILFSFGVTRGISADVLSGRSSETYSPFSRETAVNLGHRIMQK